MLEADLFIKSGLSMGFSWQNGMCNTAQDRAWSDRRTSAVNPATGSTPGWEASTKISGFSTAAVHEDEPAIIRSRSGGQI